MSSIDYKEFWEINKACMDIKGPIARVPVDLYLNGDWICEHLGLDCVRYYTDYEYQRDMRLECSKITEREFGYIIQPEIDFGVILDASIYGGEPMYRDKATPVLTHAIEDPEEIDVLIERMQSLNPLEKGLVPLFLEWRDYIDRDFGINVTYGGALKGCATMMGQILGVTNFLTWISTDPEQIAKLIDCWYDTSVLYLEAIRNVTGFVSDGKFSIYSDVAGMLSPSLYNEFIKEKERMLYERFAGNPGDQRYYHADYHMMHLLPSLREIGVNQLNIDPYVDCAQILNIIPDAVIYGQIPPTEILLYGTPEQVRQNVKKDIADAGVTRNLIVCTAGSINPGTNFENIRAICEAVKEYGYIY